MGKRFLLLLVLVSLSIIGFIALSRLVISNESSNHNNLLAGTVYDKRPNQGWNEGQREHPPSDPGLGKSNRLLGPTLGWGPGKYGP